MLDSLFAAMGVAIAAILGSFLIAGFVGLVSPYDPERDGSDA